MSEVATRLAALDPERRRLVEQLARRRQASRGGSGTATDAPRMFAAPPLTSLVAGSPDERKAHYRHIYNSLNDQLNAAPYASHIRFCTFGYVAGAAAERAQVTLPERLLNKNTIKLVLEVIGDCDLAGRDVLDVGCGRGGTLSVVTSYFRPRRVVGVDLSASAIAFCRRTYQAAHLAFHEGDAEALPFDDASFDVVTNVESSHSYPEIERFYAGVFRVLRPGGHLLYTDLFAHETMARNIDRLRTLGFTVDDDRDITPNVLLSCDATAAAKLGAYDSANDRAFMGNFLATPDSEVYGGMKSGSLTYRILKLRKPDIRA